MATRTRRTSGTTTRTKSDIITVDFDDYEGDGNVYMGDDPRPGVYGFELVKVERHVAQSSGNKGIKWTFACTDPSYEGWFGFMYSDTNPEGSKWKTQQILKAVQGGQEKPVKLDLAKPEKFIASCQPVVGRVVADAYEDDAGEVQSRAKLNRVVAESAAPKRGKAKDEETEDDEYYEDEETEEDADGFDEEDDDDDGFDDEDGDEEDEDEEGDVDEDEGDEDEEEEPEPEPAPRRRRAAPAKKAAPAKRTPAAKKAAPARRRAR